MSIDLSSYHNLQSNLFVRIDVPDYEIMRFSDYHRAYTIDGESYGSLGSLMSITDTNTELRATPEEVTITISGIPVTRIQEILDTKLKGSSIKIYRVFFNATTGAFIDIDGNPANKFLGVISNFTLVDNPGTLFGDVGTITLTMTATSAVEILQRKLSGRRTNPTDQRALYPTDAAFDKVPNLANSNFNFGVPR